MKLQRILAGVLLLSCFLVSNTAQAETSQNLIDPRAWSGATYGADPGGCCASISGSGAIYDTTTGIIKFSYGLDVLTQSIAINQALKASGIQVDGFQYHWHYKLVSNNGSGSDSLIFEVTVKDASGNLVETYKYDYSGVATDLDVHQAGIQMFKQSYMDPQSISLKIQGRDGGYWAGYYGPEVSYVDLRLIYSANPCANNALYDPSCPGYAEAYAKMLYDQNCAANPLYDSGCPGYASAYFNQQCSIDALYNVGCPGYADAYFNQQCSIDALYDVQCQGYADALYSKQCTENQLYDVGCPGYQEAYATKMILEAQQEEHTVTSVSPIETASTVYTDPVASLTNISATGDSIVDSILSPTVTAAISAPAQEVALIQMEVSQNDVKEESTVSDTSSSMDEPLGETGGGDDTGSEGESNSSGETVSGGSTESKSSSKPKSTREKVKEAMTEKAQNLANEMSEAASLQAQQAVQAQLTAIMNYNPGFAAYGQFRIPGVDFYASEEIYLNVKVPESRSGLRNGLAQQILHTQMVDSQYEGK